MISSFIAWFDLTKAIAIAGLCIALISSYFTWQNRRLAVEQEKRRAPHLLPSLVHGFFKNDESDGGRVYAFLLTVRNPSDSNNAISEADLAITYLTQDRVQLTVKLRANESKAVNFVKGQGEALTVPVSIPAHNTVSGWLHFHMPAPMLVGMEIEAYRLILTDTHRETTDVAPILVQEYRDET